MKNFSVKTADFDSLSISGESPIVQSDLGTGPNQIPLNKDLGSLAYMNAPQIEDLNVDTLELREIAAELSETAVDVFVYDTRRDSDGGAWRSRTQHTSWYNEPLNTATRGSRREFPAVAVIVAETNKVTIYDGDDPDLSMWMVFEKLGTFSFVRNNLSSVFALNGELCIGIGNAGGLSIARFANDSGYTYFTSERRTWSSVIATRTELVYDGANDTSIVIVNNTINDVAMTVLPNAPIDSETGLPIPTIAVATDDGVSVIKDDGSGVVDYTRDIWGESYNHESLNVNISKNGKLTYTSRSITGGTAYLFQYNSLSDTDVNDDPDVVLGVSQTSSNYIGLDILPRGSITSIASSKEYNFIGISGTYADGYDNGVFISGTEGIVRASEGIDNLLSAHITNESNTGWMPGDIKLAALSDNTVETVGVDESDELVTNGGFATDSDWSKGTGWTINGDVAIKTGSDNTSISQDIDTISGKNYVVSLDIVSGTVNSGAKLYVDGVLVLDNLKDAQSISVDFVATDDSTTIAINGGSFDGGSIDNISVKQTGELITNGTFDNGTGGWTEGNGVTISVDSATTSLKVEQGTSDFVACSQPINTIAGKKYTISFDLLSDGNSSVSAGIYVRSSQFSGATNIITVSNGSFGSQSATFTAIGSVTYIEPGMLSSADNIYGLFDNISVRLAEDDRSVNDNGLRVFGEITKSPVAPGADLVAYSGFTTNNYLMQPYNSDLDFGTGDFCVMGWFNTQQTSSNAYDDLLSVGDIGVMGYGAWSEGGLLIQNRTDNNKFLSYLSTPRGQTNISLPQPYYTPNAWNHFIIKREAGLASVFLNGVQEGAPVEYSYNFARNNNPNWKFAIGYTGDNYVYPANNSKLALLRISATIPTAEQIARIYRDEKVLFQDGAQATLYGTSDAVTALAYDDSENLLHVGTASGRSVFNGLKRVDNTTTAVSTAISATEGLVIEQ